jgi:hypothetical protein
LRRSAVGRQDYCPAPAPPVRTDIVDGQQRGDERRAFYVSRQRFSISQGEFTLRTVSQEKVGHGIVGELHRIPANMKNKANGNSSGCQDGHPPSRQEQDGAGDRRAMRKHERAGQKWRSRYAEAQMRRAHGGGRIYNR